MSLQNFQKPPLNNQQHLELLKERGLIITDVSQAIHYLDYIGYYRLSGFFRPFYIAVNNPQHHFKSGVSFQDIINLYEFDTKLRSIFLGGIERIEVAVRSIINNIMSTKYGAHWYLKRGLFTQEFNHNELINLIKHDTYYYKNGGKHPIFSAYYTKYNSPDLPACWMLGEVLSFGAWSKIYLNLRHGADKLEIAKRFNMPHYRVFQSWLHAISFTRNLCAHHAMVCLRNFHITPIKPINWPQQEQQIFAKPNTVFLQISMIQFLLNSAFPNTKLAPELIRLFKEYPSIHADRMGFMPGWQNFKLWRTTNIQQNIYEAINCN